MVGGADVVLMDLTGLGRKSLHNLLMLVTQSFLTYDRLLTVPYFFARSFRYTASYRHGYLDFQMYRGGGRRRL